MWKESPTPFEGLTGCAISMVGPDHCILAGGVDGKGSVQVSAYLFNLRTETWTVLPNLTTPRCLCAIAVVRYRAYLFGGQKSPTFGIHGLHDSVEWLDLRPFLDDAQRRKRREWNKLAERMMGRRQGCAAVAVELSPQDLRIYVLGGHDGTRALRSVEVLNPSSNRWIVEDTAPNMSVSRSRFGATCIKIDRPTESRNPRHVLIVAGGQKSSGKNTGTAEALEVVSSGNAKWCHLPKLRFPRSACVLLPGSSSKVVVMGSMRGAQSGFQCVAEMESITKQEVEAALELGRREVEGSRNRRSVNTWRCPDNCLPRILSDRFDFAAASSLDHGSGGFAVVFGGRNTLRQNLKSVLTLDRRTIAEPRQEANPDPPSPEAVPGSAEPASKEPSPEKKQKKSQQARGTPEDEAAATLLLQKARVGNLKRVVKHVEDRPNDVLYGDVDNRTALHLAAWWGHLRIVKYLVDKGAKVGAKDRFGNTPLDDARRENKMDIVNYLVGRQIPQTLIDACNSGDLDSLNHHLDEDGQHYVSVKNKNGQTLLHMAAKSGQAAVVERLLAYGANDSVQDDSGKKPVDIAGADAADVLADHAFMKGLGFLSMCMRGDLEAVKLHLESRPDDVNFEDFDLRTPLHLSSAEGHLEVVKYLVSKGARWDIRDEWGKTALDSARDSGSESVADLLQSLPEPGTTGFRLLFLVESGDLQDVKEHLATYPQDVNFQDVDLRTPLHIACNCGHHEIVKFLLTKKANPNLLDKEEHTPLQDAERQRHEEAADVLQKYMKGAIHSAKTRLSALLPLCQKGEVENIKKHIEAYPEDAKAADFDGRTALHLAATGGSLKLVEYLVEQGANVDAVDTWHKTPLDDAANNNHTQVVTFLRERASRPESGAILIDMVGRSVELGEIADYIEIHPKSVLYADQNRRTPLHVAASMGLLGAVKILLEKGANPSAKDSIFNRKPIEDARSSSHKAVADEIAKWERERRFNFLFLCQSGRASAVEAHLKKHPDDLETVDVQQRTPLHYAAQSGNFGVVLCLERMGAITTARDKFGRTALAHTRDERVRQFLSGLTSNPSGNPNDPIHDFEPEMDNYDDEPLDDDDYRV